MTVVLGLVSLLALGVVGINTRVGALEEQAERDLTAAAGRAGLETVKNVRFSYPFWVEHLGLVSRNEEPFPYGYGSLDVELDGCPLQSVAFSSTPNTRSWWPRPVWVADVRFLYEHVDPARGSASNAPRFHRVEFTDAQQLREALRRDLREGICPREEGGELGSPVPAVPGEPPRAATVRSRLSAVSGAEYWQAKSTLAARRPLPSAPR